MKSRLLAITLIAATLGLGACTITPARVGVYPGYHEPPPHVIVAPPRRVIVAPQPYVVIQPGFDHHHQGRQDWNHRHHHRRHWHD